MCVSPVVEDGLRVQRPRQPARAERVRLLDARVRCEHPLVEREDRSKQAERLHAVAAAGKRLAGGAAARREGEAAAEE